MLISMIFAASENGVIGKDNNLPWKLSDDLKFFKRTTLNAPIVMGRKNYESIGRPLPKRTNIILSRNESYQQDNCIVLSSIEAAINWGLENNIPELFIIGGAQIYKQSLKYVDRVYFTKVKTILKGDTYFSFDFLSDWKILSLEKYAASAKNEFDFEVGLYER